MVIQQKELDVDQSIERKRGAFIHVFAVRLDWTCDLVVVPIRSMVTMVDAGSDVGPEGIGGVVEPRTKG